MTARPTASGLGIDLAAQVWHRSGIVSMVNIFGFRDDEPSLVFVETDYSVEEVSKPESVQGYVESFERACDAALEPAATTGYLERLAKRME